MFAGTSATFFVQGTRRTPRLPVALCGAAGHTVEKQNDMSVSFEPSTPTTHTHTHKQTTHTHTNYTHRRPAHAPTLDSISIFQFHRIPRCGNGQRGMPSPLWGAAAKMGYGMRERWGLWPVSGATGTTVRRARRRETAGSEITAQVGAAWSPPTSHRLLRDRCCTS